MLPPPPSQKFYYEINKNQIICSFFTWKIGIFSSNIIKISRFLVKLYIFVHISVKKNVLQKFATGFLSEKKTYKTTTHPHNPTTSKS